MPFRFRRTLRVGPLRVNLSKSGTSFGLGGTRKGWLSSSLNVGKRGWMQTVSVPGTGLSWRQDWNARSLARLRQTLGPFAPLVMAVLFALLVWGVVAALR